MPMINFLETFMTHLLSALRTVRATRHPDSFETQVFCGGKAADSQSKSDLVNIPVGCIHAVFDSR